MKAEINWSSIGKVLGELLLVEGLLLLIPLAFELIATETDWPGFVVAASVAFLAGWGLKAANGNRPVIIHRREGFLLVSLSWILFSFVGMIPFNMSANPLSAADAFFETVSGFTTTGATTIADVESYSKGFLLWRSMTQWIGGLGIILFMLALLPQLNANGGIPMYNAETTGITHDKLHPRIRQTAATLWSVYIALTIICFLCLWIGPMSLFDALNHAMTAVSTGGFSTKNSSLAFWNSNYLSIVLIIFMLLGGVNFGLLFALWKGNWRLLFRNDIFRVYCAIITVTYLATAASLWISGAAYGFTQMLVEPLFHIVSDITTTGFSLADFSSWGSFCLTLTILLMISGGCAGSTSGAVKVDRLAAVAKSIASQIKQSVYPKRIYNIRVNSNLISEQEIIRLTAFMGIYLLLTIFGALLISLYGFTFTDSVFVSLSCIGNNGLGYGATGVEGGYHLLPDTVKWTMSFMMLAGRLELFSILVIFFPIFWKR